MISQILFVHLPTLTGGSYGLSNIPALSTFGFIFNNDTRFYYLCWIVCIACLWLFYNIIHSRVGRAIKAPGDSEVGAKAMGVDVSKYRLQIFILTSATSGLAGGIFCFYLRFVTASLFDFSLLLKLVLMMTIGGIGTVWGPVLGSFVLTWLSQLINYLGQTYSDVTIFGKHLSDYMGSINAILFAVLVIITLILLPDGLAGWLKKLHWYRKKTP
jgi:branched-chain amino acid transport system permease protein